MYIRNNVVCCEHAIVVGGKEGGETVTGAGQYNIIELAVKKIKEKKFEKKKIIITLSSRFIRSEYLTYFLMIVNETHTHIHQSTSVRTYTHTK